MRQWFHTKKIIFLLLAMLMVSSARSAEYGYYDLKKIVSASGAAPAIRHSLNVEYLDQISTDLSKHAINYPPRFDTPRDRERATSDVRRLVGMLDILISDPHANPDILLRSAYLSTIGSNLDIAGFADKANHTFQRVLSQNPSHPRANFMYGTFLAQISKPAQGLPYLEKAQSLGVADASYTLGMVYLSQGNKEKALSNLLNYKRLQPNNRDVDKLIDGIQTGRPELRTN